MAHLQELFEMYADVDEEKLFANLVYFLKAIQPICEKYEINMAIHPDDPPWKVFGLPVVVDPKILNPKEFIDEVVTERLTNPFMPDAPQRIVTDTSQKVAIRFGETIKSYLASGKDVTALNAVPLALAGWMRYLIGVDDEGKEMEVSADPLKEEIQKRLKGI